MPLGLPPGPLPTPVGGTQGGQPVGLSIASGIAPHGTITRAQIILRAQSWLGEHVPYSQTSWWTDGNGTYRQDCSGYVSMAWALPQDLDFWTGNLATVSQPIAAADLEPGDVLLNAVHHVVLFAGWADAGHTAFNLYEEATYGTDARYVVDAPLSGYLAGGFVPYRYDGVINSAIPNNPTTGAPYSALGTEELDPAGMQQPPDLTLQLGQIAAMRQRADFPDNTTLATSSKPGVSDEARLAASTGDDTASIAAGVTFSAAIAGLLAGGAFYGRRRPAMHKRRH